MELRSTAPKERFLRGQPRPRKTSRRWARTAARQMFNIGLLVGVGALGLWSVAAAGRSPELTVHRVFVEGNLRLSDGEILGLLHLNDLNGLNGLNGATNIFTLDLEQMKRELLRSAWIKEVELTRVLPATLTLDITERLPVGLAVLDELYLLAADGTILDQLGPQYPTEDLVLVRGLLDDGIFSPERARLAGRLAQALRSKPALADLVSELDVSGGAFSLLLHLRNPPLTVLVEAEGMMDRLSQLLPLSEAIRERFPGIEIVDLRFRDRIFLRFSERAPSSPEAAEAEAEGLSADGPDGPDEKTPLGSASTSAARTPTPRGVPALPASPSLGRRAAGSGKPYNAGGEPF